MKEKELALIIEKINDKLDFIINEQKEIKRQIDDNNKVNMKKFSKLQDFDEITDMRFKMLNNELSNIKKVIIEINKKLY